jgi:hypothetical protein
VILTSSTSATNFTLANNTEPVAQAKANLGCFVKFAIVVDVFSVVSNVAVNVHFLAIVNTV